MKHEGSEKPITILILEDLDSDYELVSLALKRSGIQFSSSRAVSRDDFTQAITKNPDLILADYNLPQFTALEALNIMNESGLKIPFILVTGTQTEEVAVECIKQGADDYLLKSNLIRLPSAIEHVLSNKKVEAEKEEALARLENSELKFRTLYESMPFPVIIYNPENFEILDVNRAASNLYGYTNEEFVTLNLSAIRPPEEVKNLAHKKELYLENEASYLGEWKHMNRKGEVFYVEIYNYPVVLKGIKSRVSIIHDITDRKKASDALLRSEKRYRSVFDEAPIGISNVNAEGIMINANPTLEKMLGYEKNELTGKSMLDITFPEDRNINKIQLTDVVAGRQKALRVEKRYLKKDGEIVWANVKVSGVYNDKNEFLYTISMVEDITEKKNQESALIESEKSYKGLFNSINDPIYIQDKNGCFIDVNEGALRMYGYSKTEMIGRDPSLLSAPGMNDVEETLKKVQEAFQGRPQRFEWWGRKKNGEIFPKEVSLSPGSYFGMKVVIAVARDITDRKKYEENLAKSEKKYRDLADSLPQIIFETDRQGNLVYLNKQGAEAMGYSLDMVEEAPNVFSFIHPDDRDKARLNFAKNLEGFEGRGREYRLFKNDGTLMESMLYSSPVIVEDRVEGIRGIIIDMSERKKIEKALQSSEEKYRLLYEQNLAAVFKSTIEGELIECNPTLARMFGYSSADELMKSGRRQVEMNESIKLDAIERLYREREINNVELRLKKLNGEDIWVLGNIGLIVNEDDGGLAIQGTLIDITDKKKAEDQAIIMARALTEISESVVMSDDNRKIIFVNEAFRKSYGYSNEEIIGQSPLILNSDKNDPGLQEQINEATRKGGWTGELINKSKDGREFPIFLSTSRIEDKASGRATFIAISRDITRQKESETMLKEAKERAEEMNKLKSIFLANMSHELRTPMIGILGFAGMITEDSPDPEVKQMAGTIVKSANRLTDTLNLILDLSKIEANKLDLRLRNIKISGLIEESINHYKLAAREKGIGLDSVLKDKNISSMIDERLFSQVIGNLINNAVKYTLEGKVDVVLKKENEYAVIKVIDTGIGISENSLNIIFEPFRQASEGYNRRFEGTGLGLTITKKFVELMNGSIEVESKLNKGSVFTLKFPLSVEQNEAIELQAAERQNKEGKPTGKKKNSHLLLVEDDKINVDVINLFLRGYCNVDHSSSATEAIRMVKNKKYDAILMDINLKGMSGLDAVRVIREMDEYRHTPVVAVTAYAMAGDKKRFLSNGCSHYLPKPFSKVELIGLLEEILTN